MFIVIELITTIKYDEIMMESLKNSVEILKNRIRANLELIHQNELRIKKILKEPVSEIRSKKLDRKFNVNKKILNENKDALKLQREVMKFIETYQNNFNDFIELLESSNDYSKAIISEENTTSISRDDYIELTIKGAVKFDNKHPYYNDESFLNDLLSYFISIEDYEMCSRLANR
ncbi:hypothetical protein ACFLQ3_00725 [Bacteroidota bacterium]